MASIKLIKDLEQTIENIPNFPKQGIQFKDITPIFLILNYINQLLMI